MLWKTHLLGPLTAETLVVYRPCGKTIVKCEPEWSWHRTFTRTKSLMSSCPSSSFTFQRCSGPFIYRGLVSFIFTFFLFRVPVSSAFVLVLLHNIFLLSLSDPNYFSQSLIVVWNIWCFLHNLDIWKLYCVSKGSMNLPGKTIIISVQQCDSAWAKR